LEAKDLEGLLCHLQQNWSPEQITDLLSGPDRDARKVAALALSLVGGRCCIPAVAEHLRDPDVLANQMAEHALWSIWFRCGTTAANGELARGTRCLDERHFECAFKHFQRAIDLCPDFAEAYNQRAIAFYLLEDYENCQHECDTVVELMPCHFGAWAGLGHCHAHGGRIQQAIKAYEQALFINPHLECIQQAITELRRQWEQSR
jgi:tetratricopeptide (TPR) repeat protein